jgi:hypothetical protein
MLMLLEKKDLFISLLLVEQLMKENGKEVSVMVKEDSAGLMVLVMKVFGKTTVPMEKENLLILMAMSTKATGLMIKQMVSEYILM